ncbi:hypothetical protein, partial [Mitsuokella sp.]
SKRIAIAYVHNQSMFDAYASNNIWLESQMIHVALFSFQRTTFVSSEAFVLRSLRHLLFYRSLFSLSRDF